MSGRRLIADNPNPSGMCMCGCGKKTPLATRGSKRDGTVLGCPLKYIHGHNRSKSPDRYISYNAKTGSKLLHRKIYEENYGPIPEGYVVHHKDGDKTNNSPENLVAMSRAEHQRVHHLGSKRIKEVV